MEEASQTFAHDIRPLVRRLGKPPADWQRADLVRVCEEDGIRVLNLHYPALDGKLKELRVPVNSTAYLQRILAAGERVDGSSLFPGVFEPGQSDLYVIPVYRWAFLNPWAPDELDIVCRFAGKDGQPCPVTYDNLLFAAAEGLKSKTGLELSALAELEFYLILHRKDDRFTGLPQKNYHQSAPYLHSRPLADEILRVLSSVTGCLKYCHSEVGYIDRLESEDPELDGKRVEQYEVEFDTMPIAELGCWLAVGRWLIRMIADHYSASVTFLPKLDEGMAGSGMHLHMALTRDGVNVMRGGAAADGGLSSEALRLIGGLLNHAPVLTAFGNTVAASYLRLVPGQEAPVNVCWGFSDRASLIRVPLSFDVDVRMDQLMNPGETGDVPQRLARPTVELRSPDGSAFTYLLLAGMVMAIEDGLLDPQAEVLARELMNDGRGPDRASRLQRAKSLPTSAVGAARELRNQRAFFEKRGFPPQLIDIVIAKLDDEDDDDLSARLRSLPPSERLKRARRIMHKDLHKH